MKVSIYLETDSVFQGKRQRKCGYVLAVKIRGEEKTRESFGISSGTYHQTILRALIEALSRMTVSSEICIHTQDDYVASRIPKLEEMAGNGWTDTKKTADQECCGMERSVSLGTCLSGSAQNDSKI